VATTTLTVGRPLRAHKRVRRESTDVVVVGAGLAGLAAAVTAERLGASVVVLERAQDLGGLARSFRAAGYTFDCSGHLLHLSQPETRDLVESVTAPSDWVELARTAAIEIRGHLVPYPFQLHLAYAPEHVRDECVATLPSEPIELQGDPAATGFAEWIDATLGAGIAKHFMIPYNEKISGVPVAELTCEWLGRFVPEPQLAEIREGASSRRTVEVGYNAHFVYPRNGGIDLLPRALAGEVRDIRLDTSVARIDPVRRRVLLESGDELGYREGLLCSAPLKAMPSLVDSPRVAGLDRLLRANAVACVNLGLKQLAPRFRDLHWLYLPEPRFAAYRVGFYNRFSTEMSPPGREGVYVEIANPEFASERDLVAAAVSDLVELGAIRGAEDIDAALPVTLSPAYVIHDQHTAWTRELLLRELLALDVRMIGRYGRWEYAAMEDAMRQGIEASEALLSSSVRRTAGATRR
jgi:protoporphyrinogen oxidase